MKHQLFINGIWEDSDSGETYTRVNPSNPDEVLGEYQKGTAIDAMRAIDVAEKAFQKWADTPAPVRGSYLIKAAQLMEQQKEALSVTISREMGKTLNDAKDEVQHSIDIAYYAAGEGRRLLGHTTTSEKRGKFAYTIRLPVGVIGLITPWNFPLMIAARKIFFSLVCGNTIVFKPSSEAPQTACRLIEILQKTGIPAGVVNLVTGPGDVVGSSLITAKSVRMISFCGHRDTGIKIMRDAGVKRVSLELGGKNPVIVMDDAPLMLAVNGVICGGYATSGQRCTATSRVIVHEKVKDRFEEHLCHQIRTLKMGDALNPEVNIGPLVNEKAQNKMKEYCMVGVEEGAKLLAGGHIPSNLKGWFFEPTLFTKCENNMRICREEIFGPIISILSVGSIDEAIDTANSVDYGLSSAIYTSSMNSVFKAINRLQAGLTYVNHPTIGSEAHMPFGGVKCSGNNRESGPQGINEFTELKTVNINYSAPTLSDFECSFGEISYGSP